MSSPQSAKADSERPPGPHRPEIQLVIGGSPKSSKDDSERTHGNDSQESPKDDARQRFVLTDPIAFRYLEEDSSVTVLERHRELVGYEIYVVEQWATSRSHPTFVITTFTGDPSHKAFVNVLSVPTDESSWSQRLRVYFKALNQYHARRRETSLGVLMITNLSGFPSSLTVIPFPDGDLRKHRFDFFVNEDLKRMGCSGRVGLSLAPPNGATVAKYLQVYRTSDKNPLYSSVIELVKLCQAALHLFDKLEIDYADGLLCDITEKAINDWWIGIGSEHYNVEPHDGILGPTTVVSLLGLLMGARNRLHAISITAPKDPFDIQGMKKAIGSFQKSQHLNRSRRLDRDTLRRLHKASAKAASSEGWSVPRAVKSTVAELSGKGGEMLAEAVGRRDKAGIADIETSDIERFYQVAYGERCRWLWHGKPLKTLSLAFDETAGSQSRLVLKPDENGGFTWTGRKSEADHILPSKGATAGTDEVPSELTNLSSRGDYVEDQSKEDLAPHRSVIKRATDLISGEKSDKPNHKRSGFGRLRDAVGIRGHHRSSPSNDDYPMSPTEDTEDEDKRPSLWRSHTSPPVSPTSPKATDQNLDDTLKKQLSRAASYRDPPRADPPRSNPLVQTAEESQKSFIPLGRQSPDDSSSRQKLRREDTVSTYQTNGSDDGENNSVDDREEEKEPSIAGSFYHGVDLHDVFPTPSTFAQEIGPLLRRTNSYTAFVSQNLSKPRADDYYPRHLSFSLAQDSTASHDDYNSVVAPPASPKQTDPIEDRFSHEMLTSSDLKGIRAALANLDKTEAAWTRTQLFALRALLDEADNHAQAIEDLYYSPLHGLQDLRDASAGILRDEKEALGEAGKELETLAARMDYEISALGGKIEDVEVGVGDFERSVGHVEERVNEMEAGDRDSGWCVVM